MDSSYRFGVAAAVAAGIIFNLGILVQKLAVMKTPGKADLMRRLIRSPLWLTGFALQFFIGMPLNMLAQAKIGPAIIPALMAIGLAVLAIGAAALAGERIRLVDAAGIVLVISSVILMGLSRLSVDMRLLDLYEPAFLTRLGAFTLAVGALSLLCHLAQKTNARLRGLLLTLNAGLLLSQSNLWLGVLMALQARWGVGRFSATDLLYIALASGIVFTGSMLGIAHTQRAFQHGQASRLIPIQYVPLLTLPVAAYFSVFALSPATPQALPLALAGIALALAGAVLLGGRQPLANGGAENA